MVEDTIQDVVERIHRHGDRGRNAGDAAGEQEAREAARRAQDAPSVKDALRIEQALQQGPVIVDQEVVKKKPWWRRWLFGDDDADTDNS